MFLKISQNSQENNCARVSFFNKVAGLRSATLLKKRLWHKRFPVNFAKLLRAPFFNWTPLDDCFYINVAVTIWYQFLKILHFTISLHSSHSSLYGVLQKQPPEVFFQKKQSENARKIHRETPVLESLLLKLQAFNCSGQQLLGGMLKINSGQQLLGDMLKINWYTSSEQ